MSGKGQRLPVLFRVYHDGKLNREFTETRAVYTLKSGRKQINDLNSRVDLIEEGDTLVRNVNYRSIKAYSGDEVIGLFGRTK